MWIDDDQSWGVGPVLAVRRGRQDRVAQSLGQRTRQTRKETGLLAAEVGMAGDACDDQTTPAGAAINERGTKLGVEAVGDEQLAVALAVIGPVARRSAQCPDPSAAG